ncbi:hypothetical protein L0F81_33785 [Streptomyces tricolor]|uniref:Uncharacterized protein n=2 Tax=Streptomyces tricolor TaxID=68277 RepID=A0ABS9JRK4_9ACTN|nr:hypothetical protein [Streptomyces tricolor]MCG0068180.1 hypothetical protein [Streptomyces tricolor]
MSVDPTTDPTEEHEEPVPIDRDSRGAQHQAADVALSIARTTVTRVGSGARHAGVSIRHRLLTAHQSDEEIRRHLVARQYAAYEAVREQAREEIEEVHTRITRLEQIGAEEGWTPEQRQEVKGLREERKRRTAALKDLSTVPFVPVEPTADQIKAARRASSTRRFIAMMVVVGALGALLVVRPQLLLLVLPAAVAVLWWLGRRPPTLTQRPIPERLLARPELALPAQASDDISDEEELPTYAIADATTSDEAVEALRRALVRAGGDVAEVTEGRREPWGWSARVRVRTGSPDDFNKDDTYRNLITLLRLRRNGLLIEADPEAGDSCTMRMLLQDPFRPELVGPAPYRAPLSGSILNPFDFGVGMDASQMAFTLAGLMLLMVGDSGSAKSGISLAIAEAITSCTDAALINVDPVGTGVGALGDAITLNACMDQELIGDVLDFLLKLCAARARQRQANGWGDTWRVSPEHPAICASLDEWPQLNEKNKKKLIRLLVLGRKEGIWFYCFSQWGTKDYLGDAIGPKLKGKMLGACRRVDVTELLGGGAIAEGYRADLLEAATHTEINDAGQVYAQGLPGLPKRPLRYKFRQITPEHAARVGAERGKAGLPDLTLTLTEAGLIEEWRKLVARSSGTAGSDEPDVPHVLSVIADAFVREDDPAFLALDQVHAYLREDDAARWGRWDDRDDKGRLRELSKALTRALRAEGVELSTERITEAPGKPSGYYAAAVQAAMAKATASEE